MGKLHQLSDAVARGAGLVLSLPSPDGLSHHKSRFLGEDSAGVWVNAPSEARQIEPTIANCASVGVTFKSANVRQVFASTVLRRDAEYPLAGGGTADALLLALPAEIKAVQRRSNFRVQILPESRLTLDCWIIGRRADLKERPLPSQKVKLEVCDISLGGAGVMLPVEPGKPPAITSDDRLRIQVRLGDLELLVEGRLRSASAVLGTGVRTGIRFYFLDDGVDERLKVSQLAKIIAQLEIKQVKAIRKQSEAIEAQAGATIPVPAAC
jgi:c-di-GMP-binding flagellar brake protein YcgR